MPRRENTEGNYLPLRKNVQSGHQFQVEDRPPCPPAGWRIVHKGGRKEYRVRGGARLAGRLAGTQRRKAGTHARTQAEQCVKHEMSGNTFCARR